MGDGAGHSPDFDRDVIDASAAPSDAQEDLRGIITAIARASHDVADLVSLGKLASVRPDNGDLGVGPASTARRILVDHLSHSRVKELSCAGDGDTAILDEKGLYTVTIDPLEGMADADANLPFGTIFSIATAQTSVVCAAGFIHYGPQTNLVLTMAAGVHIFNLDRTARTYRLSAENVRIPEDTREWAVDVTKRGRWPSSVQALVDERLGEADTPGAVRADVRWTGSLTADAYRILRRGGIYLCPKDEQPGREDSCPYLCHAARPVAFIIEQAGGRATTGYNRLDDRPAKEAAARTPLIFGSSGIVDRFERLHALPESSFDASPLFSKRGLFHV